LRNEGVTKEALAEEGASGGLVTVDLTNEFKSLRADRHGRQRALTDAALHLYTEVSLTAQTQAANASLEPTAPPASSRLGLSGSRLLSGIGLASREPRPFAGESSPPPAGRTDEESSISCTQCEKALCGQYRSECPLCLNLFCGNCCCAPLPLLIDPLDYSLADNPAFKNWKPGDRDRAHLIACLACAGLILERKATEEFLATIAEAGSHPLIHQHQVMIQTRKHINSLLPRFRDWLAQLSDPTIPPSDILANKTRKAGDALGGHLTNFRLVLNKIREIKPESRSMAKLQFNIVHAMKNFLERVLPQIRVGQKEIQALLSSAAFQQRLEEARNRPASQRVPTVELPTGDQVQRPGDSGRPIGGSARVQAEPPHVSGIDPVFCPMSGGNITLTGKHFMPSTAVWIEGHRCNCQVLSANKIIATAPPLKTEGLKSIKVINIGAEPFIRDGILLYSHIEEEQPKDTFSFLQTMYGRENPNLAAGMLGGANPLALALSREHAEQPPPAAGMPRPRVPERQHAPSSARPALTTMPRPDLKLVPEIRCVSSLFVPLGGAVVRLSGAGLDPNLRLYIGDDEADLLDFQFEAMPAQSAADAQPLAQLSFVAPVKESPGFYTLRVVNPDGATAQLPGSFCYDDQSSTQPGLAAARHMEEPSSQGTRQQAMRESAGPRRRDQTANGEPSSASGSFAGGLRSVGVGAQSRQHAVAQHEKVRPTRAGGDRVLDRRRRMWTAEEKVSVEQANGQEGNLHDDADEHEDLIVPPPSHLLAQIAPDLPPTSTNDPRRSRSGDPSRAFPRSNYNRSSGDDDDDDDDDDGLEPPPAFFNSTKKPLDRRRLEPDSHSPGISGTAKMRQRRKWG